MNLKTVAKAWSIAACLLLVAPPASAGTILGSAHDFSVAAWGGGQICVACHATHKAAGGGSAAPLWNHTLTTQIYTLYASSTLKATQGQPTAGDKLCLSCHDGTVALDSYRDAAGTSFITKVNNLGATPNLHHPSSILYDTALFALKSGSLFDPASKVVTVGAGAQSKTGTIGAIMLSGGLVQCSSCHDVHNTYSASTRNLLKISNGASAICFACHDY